LDVYLPANSINILVSEGQCAVAGETVLAEFTVNEIENEIENQTNNQTDDAA